MFKEMITRLNEAFDDGFNRVMVERHIKELEEITRLKSQELSLRQELEEQIKKMEDLESGEYQIQDQAMDKEIG